MFAYVLFGIIKPDLLIQIFILITVINSQILGLYHYNKIVTSIYTGWVPEVYYRNYSIVYASLDKSDARLEI